MRELRYPEVGITPCQEGFRLVFRVPRSKFGPVVVVLDAVTAATLARSIELNPSAPPPVASGGERE